jgi:hypothetical protein
MRAAVSLPTRKSRLPARKATVRRWPAASASTSTQALSKGPVSHVIADPDLEQIAQHKHRIGLRALQIGTPLKGARHGLAQVQVGDEINGAPGSRRHPLEQARQRAGAPVFGIRPPR